MPTEARRVKFCGARGQEEELLVGQDYEITYCIEGVQRVDRKMRMGFLGTTTSGELQFDGRGPNRSTDGQYSGTSELRPTWIKAVRQVPRSLAERYTEKRA